MCLLCFFVLRPPCKGDRHHSTVSYVFRHGLALAWCGPVWLCCAVEMLRPWPGVALALLWPWSCCGPSRSVDLGPILRKFPAVSPHIPCKLQTGTPPAAPKLLVSSRRTSASSPQTSWKLAEASCEAKLPASSLQDSCKIPLSSRQAPSKLPESFPRPSCKLSACSPQAHSKPPTSYDKLPASSPTGSPTSSPLAVCNLPTSPHKLRASSHKAHA